MTPQRWSRIKDVFHDALLKDPEQRAALLQLDCAGDVELRAEVESLLASHEAAPGFIEPGEPVLPATVTAVDDPLPGKMLGPYRILRALAYGGMGAVYLARRADQAYVKDVAIKVLRRDQVLCAAGRHDELLRRFQVERQTLASLDHPHIARLIDGGLTSDGLPYLVMDHIEGQPIDEYCAARKCTTTQRLALFRQVCAAVHCAHQHLVVHRDLKPRNILVAGDGTPRLLDFGIAKLLDPLAPAATTRTGLQPMTPEYASPEQLRGEAVTTASDIYSLGVVLYELLTGRRPQPSASGAPAQIGRGLRELPVHRPSTVVARADLGATRRGSSWIVWPRATLSVTDARQAPRLRRRLAGDLDMIVLKALHHEPARRYGSVEHLSEDIRRHLDGLPVLARPDTLWYRASKFVRRHAVGAALCTVLLSALLVTTVAATLSARAARRARAQAQEEARGAGQVAEFLVQLFEMADPLRAEGEPAAADYAPQALRPLLDQAAAQIAVHSETPLVRARLLDALGRVYSNLGEYARAEPLLAEAAAIRGEQLGPHDARTLDSCRSLGLVHVEQGRYAEAEPELLQVAQTCNRILGAEHDGTLDAELALAVLYTRQARYDQARSLLQRNLDVRLALLGADHASVLEAKNNLAFVYKEQGRFAEAEPLYHEVLQTRERLLGADHVLTTKSMNNLAALHLRLGNYAAAEPLYLQSLKTRRQVLGDGDLRTLAALNNLAALYKRQGRFDEAVPMYRQVLEQRRVILGPQHPATLDSVHSMAQLHEDLGQFAEAEPLFIEALDGRKRLLGTEHPRVLATMNNLAALYAKQNRAPEAEDLYLRAAEVCRRVLGEEHPDTLIAWNNLAVLYKDHERYAEAEPLLVETLEVRRRILPAEHPDVLASLNNLAGLFKEQGRYQEAEPLYSEALESCRRTLGDDHRFTLVTTSGLGDLYCRMGRSAPAAALLADAVERGRRTLPPGHWYLGRFLVNYGRWLLSEDRFEEAQAALLEAQDILQAKLGEGHPLCSECAELLADLHERWGHAAEE